jgi:hypothetical protein
VAEKNRGRAECLGLAAVSSFVRFSSVTWLPPHHQTERVLSYTHPVAPQQQQQQHRVLICRVCVCLACLFWQTLTSSFDSLKSAECAGVWRRRRPKKRNVETVSRCGDWNCVDGRDSCVNGTTSQQGNQEGVHNTFCVLRRRSFHALGPRSFVQQFLQYYPTRRCVSSSSFWTPPFLFAFRFKCLDPVLFVGHPPSSRRSSMTQTEFCVFFFF